MLQSIWSFAPVAGLLTLTPGIDTALVLRTAAGHPRAAAFATALGICAGCLAWGIAAALGSTWLLVWSWSASASGSRSPGPDEGQDPARDSSSWTVTQR